MKSTLLCLLLNVLIVEGAKNWHFNNWRHGDNEWKFGGSGGKEEQAPDDQEKSDLNNLIQTAVRGTSGKDAYNNELRKKYEKDLGKGGKVIRLQQYYNDIRVLGGEVVQIERDDASDIEVWDRKTRQPTGKKRKLEKLERRNGRWVADLHKDNSQLRRHPQNEKQAFEHFHNKFENDRRNGKWDRDTNRQLGGGWNNKQNRGHASQHDYGKGRNEALGFGSQDNSQANNGRSNPRRQGNRGNGARNNNGHREKAGNHGRWGRQINETKQWNEKSEQVIRVDENTGQVFINYITSYFTYDNNGDIVWPHAILDQDLNVLAQWNGLHHYEVAGVGGNRKTDRYTWGKTAGFEALDVSQNGALCQMQNENVRLIDMQNTLDDTRNTVLSFACSKPDNNTVNEGYSPVNDAYGHANYVFDIFHNWYNLYPVKPKPLPIRVHYGFEYENAFWDGEQLTFGDGGNDFYPLTTLDILAHEFGHAITDYSSNLLYAGESGAINEAFSDMTGKFFDAISQGLDSNYLPLDWSIGGSVTKIADKALRYMDEPSKDGQSFDNVKDIGCVSSDVHRTSGIFNRAFVEFAKRSPLGIYDAYEIFMSANLLKWMETSGFEQAAEGTLELMSEMTARNDPLIPPHLIWYEYDYLNVNDLKEAFSTVGINCENVTGTNWQCTKMSSATNLSKWQQWLAIFLGTSPC